MQATRHDHKEAFSKLIWPSPLDLFSKGKEWFIGSKNRNLAGVEMLNSGLNDSHRVFVHGC